MLSNYAHVLITLNMLAVAKLRVGSAGAFGGPGGGLGGSAKLNKNDPQDGGQNDPKTIKK